MTPLYFLLSSYYLQQEVDNVHLGASLGAVVVAHKLHYGNKAKGGG